MVMLTSRPSTAVRRMSVLGPGAAGLGALGRSEVNAPGWKRFPMTVMAGAPR